jgi:hypothetical protein
MCKLRSEVFWGGESGISGASGAMTSIVFIVGDNRKGSQGQVGEAHSYSALGGLGCELNGREIWRDNQRICAVENSLPTLQAYFRQFHVKAGTVYAFKYEIDTWIKIRCRSFSKSVPQERHSDQSVDWSSPTKLVAIRAGNSCWLWLMAAPGSHRLDMESRVAITDGKVDDRKTIATNQSWYM